MKTTLALAACLQAFSPTRAMGAYRCGGMKQRSLVFAVLLGTLAPAYVAPEKALPAPSTELPGNLSPTFPRKAIDHVVTYEAWRGWGPKGGDRIVLFRHGTLVRTKINYIGSKRA